MTEVSCKSEPLKRRTVPEALRVVSDSGVEVFQKILDCWGVGRRVSLRMICKFSVKISVVLRFGLPDRAETCDGCCDSSVRFSLHFVSHFPRHYRYCFRSWRKSVFADNLQFCVKISVVLRFGLPDHTEMCDGCCDSSGRLSLQVVSHFPRHYRYCFRS